MESVRRIVAVAVVVGLSLSAGACTRQPIAVVTTSGTSAESPSPSATPSPTPPPVDPAATQQTCAQALAETSNGTQIFNVQIAALEQAAAVNDQAALVAAADAINKEFTALAATTATLAARPVSPQLKTALTDISAALSVMSSTAYTGTTVDIRKKLADFAAALNKACVPPASASPGPSS
jgi:hypothetical protein